MTYRDTSADTTLDGANMENEFKKWAFDNNVTTLYPISYGAAKDAWNARQTEIDDLKMRVENYKQCADGVSIQLSQANKEIDALENELSLRAHGEKSARIRVEMLKKEIDALKAENELNLAANRGLGRLVDVLQAENERLRRRLGVKMNSSVIPTIED